MEYLSIDGEMCFCIVKNLPFFFVFLSWNPNFTACWEPALFRSESAVWSALATYSCCPNQVVFE